MDELDKQKQINIIKNKISKLETNSTNDIINRFDTLKTNENSIDLSNFPPANKDFIITDLNKLNTVKYNEIGNEIIKVEELLKALKDKNSNFIQKQKAKDNLEGSVCSLPSN